MQRYFFDLVGERPQYDFSGQVLPSLTRVHEVAELMALDLSIEHDDPWRDCCVHVLTAQGQRIHSVPVRRQAAA
jgi:hypothetical protein